MIETILLIECLLCRKYNAISLGKWVRRKYNFGLKTRWNIALI